VLDNFEHVREATGDISHLLWSCPELSILVTSRVPLRIDAEHEVSVEPLDLRSAAALFADRAQAVRPDFTVGRANESAVCELSRRLDGLPLAIELAAPRVCMLSPEAMLQRLGDGLDLLGSDSSDRHRTLRDTIAWSHDSASYDVGRARGRPLRDARDRARVRRRATRRARRADELERRHAEHYVAFAASQSPRLRRTEAEQAQACALLDDERDNFRTACLGR
jgi:hypothetical protein